MIVVVKMKNVILRGKTYFFRQRVPKDCIAGIGQREIVESLGTKDTLEADKKAVPLRKKWKAKFEKIRNPSSIARDNVDVSVFEESVDYYQEFRSLADQNLPTLLDSSSEEDLRLSGEFFRDCSSIIQNAPSTQFDLPELGLSWPLSSAGSHGKNRKRKRALVKVFGELCAAVADKLGESLGEELAVKTPKAPEQPSVFSEEETDLLKVAKFLIQLKTRDKATSAKIRAEVLHLKEWTKNKSDITKYTKADLIDYVQKCLPHIPPNISRKKACKGKSLRECVALTISDPKGSGIYRCTKNQYNKNVQPLEHGAETFATKRKKT